MATLQSSLIVFGGIVWFLAIAIPMGRYYYFEVIGWLIFIVCFGMLSRWLSSSLATSISHGRLLDVPSIPIMLKGTLGMLLYLFTEFLVLPVAMIYLLIRDKSAFLHFRLSLLFVSLVGVFIFLVFPVAPPWAIHHVQTGQSPWGAFPSLHVAAALLVGWFCMRRYWYVWPLFVSVVVLITGNHYFPDVISGLSLGGISIWVVGYLALAGGFTPLFVVSSTESSFVGKP